MQFVDCEFSGAFDVWPLGMLIVSGPSTVEPVGSFDTPDAINTYSNQNPRKKSREKVSSKKGTSGISANNLKLDIAKRYAQAQQCRLKEPTIDSLD